MAYLTRRILSDGTVELIINLTLPEIKELDAGKTILIQQKAGRKLVGVSIDVKDLPADFDFKRI